MSNYERLDNPKSLIGKEFLVKDKQFNATRCLITRAYWAYDNDKELVLEGCPDGLRMMWTLLPNKDGLYNLSRILQ